MLNQNLEISQLKNMKNRKRKIERKVQLLMYWWTCKIDGDEPVKFEDELAFMLFSDSLFKMMWQMYRIGIKDERKRRKRKQTIKFLKRK